MALVGSKGPCITLKYQINLNHSNHFNSLEEDMHQALRVSKWSLDHCLMIFLKPESTTLLALPACLET